LRFKHPAWESFDNHANLFFVDQKNAFIRPHVSNTRPDICNRCGRVF